jgi:hypothetical protein
LQSGFAKLYERIGLKAEVPADVDALPEVRERDFSLLKYQMIRHPYRADILSLIEGRAETFGYSADLSALPGSGLLFLAKSCLEPWREPKKKKTKTGCQARAGPRASLTPILPDPGLQTSEG